MERCPACRSRLGDTPICPRCGCDFTLAIRAQWQALRLSRQSVLAWHKGEYDMAKAYINKSLLLKQDRLTESLAIMFCEHKESTIEQQALPPV
jgi:hypothetical protein